MRLVALVMLAALSSAIGAPAQTVVSSSRAPVGSCAAIGAGPAAFIELAAPVGARDTLATFRVCLVTGAPSDPPASFHGELQWDSTRAVAATIARPRIGMVLENATRPGRIVFAGASPSGFPEALVLTVALRLVRAGMMPPVALSVRELNTISARSLGRLATVTGWPKLASTPRAIAESGTPSSLSSKPTVPAAPPRIARLTPAFAPAEIDEPPVVDIIGEAFAAEGNTVTFGPVVFGNVTSANGGTLIRLVVPREATVSREAPPMRLTAGTYRVSVRTARGQSNVVEFELR